MGQPGKPGRGWWKDRQGWLRSTPLVGLAATHYSSEEFVIVFMVFNSGSTRHRNQVFCKHLSVFAATSVGNLEINYAEFSPTSLSSP